MTGIFRLPEAGTYRVNRINMDGAEAADVRCGPRVEVYLQETLVNYEEKPRESTLCVVTTSLGVQTRVSELYPSPYDQIRERLRLIVELVKERQKKELSITPTMAC